MVGAAASPPSITTRPLVAARAWSKGTHYRLLERAANQTTGQLLSLAEVVVPSNEQMYRAFLFCGETRWRYRLPRDEAPRAPRREKLVALRDRAGRWRARNMAGSPETCPASEETALTCRVSNQTHDQRADNQHDNNDVDKRHRDRHDAPTRRRRVGAGAQESARAPAWPRRTTERPAGDLLVAIVRGASGTTSTSDNVKAPGPSAGAGTA